MKANKIRNLRETPKVFSVFVQTYLRCTSFPLFYWCSPCKHVIGIPFTWFGETSRIVKRKLVMHISFKSSLVLVHHVALWDCVLSCGSAIPIIAMLSVINHDAHCIVIDLCFLNYITCLVTRMIFLINLFHTHFKYCHFSNILLYWRFHNNIIIRT